MDEKASAGIVMLSWEFHVSTPGKGHPLQGSHKSLCFSGVLLKTLVPYKAGYDNDFLGVAIGGVCSLKLTGRVPES